MSKGKSKSEKELIDKIKFIEKHGLDIPKKTFFQRHPIIENIFYLVFGSTLLTSIVFLLAKCSSSF